MRVGRSLIREARLLPVVGVSPYADGNACPLESQGYAWAEILDRLLTAGHSWPIVRVVSSLRIAELRETQGLTQVELARLTGVDQRTIRRWEKGKDAKVVNLRLVARALNVSIDDLFKT